MQAAGLHWSVLGLLRGELQEGLPEVPGNEDDVVPGGLCVPEVRPLDPLHAQDPVRGLGQGHLGEHMK